MPCTPIEVRASRTSSSLNGLMMAMTIFMGLNPPAHLLPDAARQLSRAWNRGNRLRGRCRVPLIKSRASCRGAHKLLREQGVLTSTGEGPERCLSQVHKCGQTPPKFWADVYPALSPAQRLCRKHDAR